VVGVAALMVSATPGAFDALKFASPPYAAVRLCDPAVNVDVVNVASTCPPTAFTAPVPRGVAPSENVTVPVGVPLPGASSRIVAVTFTPCPTVAGFVSVTIVVVVPALFTVCASGADVDPPDAESPP